MVANTCVFFLSLSLSLSLKCYTPRKKSEKVFRIWNVCTCIAGGYFSLPLSYLLSTNNIVVGNALTLSFILNFEIFWAWKDQGVMILQIKEEEIVMSTRQSQTFVTVLWAWHLKIMEHLLQSFHQFENFASSFWSMKKWDHSSHWFGHMQMYHFVIYWFIGAFNHFLKVVSSWGMEYISIVVYKKVDILIRIASSISYHYVSGEKSYADPGQLLNWSWRGHLGAKVSEVFRFESMERYCLTL